MAGNANSGRPTKAQELANAEYLWKILTEETDVAELERKVETTKKHSLLQLIALKAFRGDAGWIDKIFTRFFPDVTPDDTSDLPNPDQIQQLAGVVRRFAVELQPGVVPPLPSAASGAEPTPLRTDVSAALPDQPGAAVPPGDNQAPAGPAAAGGSPS